jgi:uncharacterized protein YacL
MMIHFFRGLVILAGPIIGYFKVSQDAKGILIGVAFAVAVIAIEILINQVPLGTMVAGGIGTIIGLLVAFVLEKMVLAMNDPNLIAFFDKYSLLIQIVLAYLGMILFVRKYPEVGQLDRDILIRSGVGRTQDVKVLDTSSLIDGRVADICDTYFLTGTLVVPHFVLNELQNIADSSDPNRRARGRRGLDVLKHLQESSNIKLNLFEKDFPDLNTVDAKVVQLAKDLSARVLTTDFNLNKVASLQGVTVLNVNDLAGALRPVALPGDNMNIFIVKEGKEREQGIGYLDDGTMVVVEEGRRFISKGKPVEVVVSSILQTSSGRMVFARPRERGGSHA